MLFATYIVKRRDARKKICKHQYMQKPTANIKITGVTNPTNPVNKMSLTQMKDFSKFIEL